MKIDIIIFKLIFKEEEELNLKILKYYLFIINRFSKVILIQLKYLLTKKQYYI